MKTNLALTYVNIMLFIMFAGILGQPEHVFLIHMCTVLSGTLVANNLYKSNLISYGKFFLYDMYVHWVPAILTLLTVDFYKIGPRQFMFAAVYPILYLGIQSYKNNKGWTQFKITNPKEHLEKMYPGVDTRVYILYYVILIGAYLFRDQLGFYRC